MENLNRIQINGEWYVRESTITETPIVVTENDCTFTLVSTYETEDSLWEASIIYRNYSDNILHNDSIAIEYTNKKKWRGGNGDNSIVEYWDNPVWLRRVRGGDVDAIAAVEMSNSEIEHLRAFLRMLTELGWL